MAISVESKEVIDIFVITSTLLVLVFIIVSVRKRPHIGTSKNQYKNTHQASTILPPEKGSGKVVVIAIRYPTITGANAPYYSRIV